MTLGAVTGTMPARIALHELVALFGGTCGGNLRREVTGFASLADASPDQLAFVSAARYRAAAETSLASAILVTEKDAELLAAVADRLWVCRDPYLQFARIAQRFEALSRAPLRAGIDATAVVADDAHIDPSATIGPLAVIGDRASIAADVTVGAGSHVGAGSRIDEGSLIHPGVVIYPGCTIGKRCIVHAGAVIGADGFGFAKDGAQWVKIPQVGGVVIGDDVEIGANTTIDRGALADTRIGDGVKLDNQIQIGHNVDVGEHTIMAAFVGVAGSAIIGKRCQIGGAARIMGHVTIADDVVVSTQTFVSRSISKPGQYTGYYPMAAHADFEKSAAVLRRLDRLRERVRRLEADRRAAAGNALDDAARDTSEPERPA